MLGKLKQFFAPVGVSVTLEVEPYLPTFESVITGVIHIIARREQQITEIRATLKQSVQKGYGKERQRQVSAIGEVTVDSPPFTIKPGETRDFTFSLPFTRHQTFAQTLAEADGLVGMAGRFGALMDSPQEAFWVEAKANVKGALFDPHDTQKLTKE